MTVDQITDRIVDWLEVDPAAVADGQQNAFTLQRIADACGVPASEALAALTLLVADGRVVTYGLRDGIRWWRLAEPDDHATLELPPLTVAVCPAGHRVSSRVTSGGRRWCDQCQQVVPCGESVGAAA